MIIGSTASQSIVLSTTSSSILRSDPNLNVTRETSECTPTVAVDLHLPMLCHITPIDRFGIFLEGLRSDTPAIVVVQLPFRRSCEDCG